jgi:hypothetical protein
LAFQSNKDYDGLPQALHPNTEVQGEVYLMGLAAQKKETPGACASGLIRQHDHVGEILQAWSID